MTRNGVQHSVSGATLADVLERILDKGVVIAGDIKIKLVDIELLTIQIRLMIASVDKAREMGMDWWLRNPDFSSAPLAAAPSHNLAELEERLTRLEAAAPDTAAAGSHPRKTRRSGRD